MLFVSLNHCDAIQLLAQKRNFASAYALLRPLFETTFRSMWLHRCATDEQLNKCIQKDEWESAWVLIPKSRIEYQPAPSSFPNVGRHALIHAQLYPWRYPKRRKAGWPG
ncbi:DUF5677 domain-containing protein [Alteromonas sp.]|uniref:DUF6988 family protein n=1 Tax=Alteromonas sp. TaxID=232 RepID=UPI00338F1C22